MRIGIDARMIKNTGIGRYLRNLVIHLAHIDPRNHYVVFVNAGDSTVIDQANVHFVNLAISVPVYSLREQWWFPIELRRARLDVVHFPNFDVPLVASRPCVVTIHDLIYYLYPEQCPSRVAQYYAGFMLRQATRKANVLITDSEHSKRDLIKHFDIPAENIEVIYPAAETPGHPAASSKLWDGMATRYGITRPYILYVGKHHAYKNIRTLLRAFDAHQDVCEMYQLVIAGKKDPRREALYHEARSLRSGGSIIFTDFVPDDEVFELYRHARLFVFPSLYEGFGLPPLEAMACGVPVISSNAASLPEVVGDAAIQVDPLDVNGMADAMRNVLNRPALWNELRHKGLQRAQHFSWDTAARQLLAIYERFR